MDPEDMAKKALGNLLANHGLVQDNFGQNNELAASHRDQILGSLTEQGLLSDFEGAKMVSIYAWNPQMGALFFNNGKFLVTYKMASGQPWQLAQTDEWEGNIDPYDLDGIDVSNSNVQLMDPKLFVYTGKDGVVTAAGRMGIYTS
jgi:hypothetical protein